MTTATTNSLNNVLQTISKMNLSKPQHFKAEFSRDKLQKAYLNLCDGAMTVHRFQGNGSFPMCLGVSPFSPISN